MKNTQKGFTLVELLVVIAILAILAGVGVAGYTTFIDRANMSNAQTEADQIKSIIDNALMVDDYVILDEVIFAKKDGTFVATEPTEGKGFDASEDIAEFEGALEIKNNKLVYTNYGYEVDVMARTATKAE